MKKNPAGGRSTSYSFTDRVNPHTAPAGPVRFIRIFAPYAFYELQIGKIFASYPQYFSAFKSCNRRTAEAPWCCECPKCASVFLTLAAFIDEETVSRIFKADLLADPKLVDTITALCGRGSYKPLECVGRQDESLLALYLASKRRKATPLHPDLAAILPEASQIDELQSRILDAYGNENGLPSHWQDQLRRMVG